MSRRPQIFLIEEGGISNSLYAPHSLSDKTIDEFFERIGEKTVYSKIKNSILSHIFTEKDANDYKTSYNKTVDKSIKMILARTLNFEYREKLININNYCNKHSVDKVDEFFAMLRVLREYDPTILDDFLDLKEYIDSYRVSIGIVYKETNLIQGDLIYYKNQIYDNNFNKMSDNKTVLGVYQIYFGNLFGKMMYEPVDLIGYKLNIEAYIEGSF